MWMNVRDEYLGCKAVENCNLWPVLLCSEEIAGGKILQNSWRY